MKFKVLTLLAILVLGVLSPSVLALDTEHEDSATPALRYRMQQTRGNARHLMGKGGKGGDDDDVSRPYIRLCCYW